MSDPKTSIAAYASSGSLVILGVSVNDLALVVGIALGVATFVVNWIYKHKHFRLIERQIKHDIDEPCDC